MIFKLKKNLICSILMLMNLFSAFEIATAQDINFNIRKGHGLEIGENQSIEVLVDYLPTVASEWSLYESDIKTKVELFLRREEFSVVSSEEGGLISLYITVSMVEDIFSIEMKLLRRGSYVVGDVTYYHDNITTWGNSIIGRSEDKRSAYFYQQLDKLLDDFLNSYLKANS